MLVGTLLGAATLMNSALFGSSAKAQMPVAVSSSPIPAAAVTAQGQNTTASVAPSPAAVPPSPLTPSDPTLNTPNAGLPNSMTDPLVRENARLQNDRQRLLNAKEGLLNRRAEQGNAWLGVELGALQRLDRDQQLDLKQLKAHKARLVLAREQILLFVNGRAPAGGMSAVLSVYAQREQTPGMASLLQHNVPPLGSDNFQAAVGSVIGQVLQSDGQLTPFPACLQGIEAARQPAKRLQDYWSKAAGLIAKGQLLNQRQQAALQSELDDLRTAIEEHHEALPSAARIQADRHVRLLQALLEKLNRPQQLAEVQAFVRGYSFPGGTVAQLLQYIGDSGAGLRFGSRAQLVVKELGNDLLRDIESEIALVETRLDTYVAKNPSHNAAMRTVLVSETRGSESWNGLGGNLAPGSSGIQSLGPVRENDGLLSYPTATSVRGNLMAGVPVRGQAPAPSTQADRLTFLNPPGAAPASEASPVPVGSTLVDLRK